MQGSRPLFLDITKKIRLAAICGEADFFYCELRVGD